MRLHNPTAAAKPRSFRRPGFLIALFLCIAGLATFLTYSYLQSAVPTQQVLVALREIPPDTPVRAADFGVTTVPKTTVPSDALTDSQAVDGLLTRGTLLKGEIARQGHLVRYSGSALSFALSRTPDLVLISLTPEAMEGLVSQVAVGDRLDILGVMQINNGKTNETRVGRLATGALVAAVLSPPKESSGLGGAQPNPVLVAVTQAEAAAIKLSQATGKVFVQLSVSKNAAPPVMTPETVLPGGK